MYNGRGEGVAYTSYHVPCPYEFRLGFGYFVNDVLPVFVMDNEVFLSPPFHADTHVHLVVLRTRDIGSDLHPPIREVGLFLCVGLEADTRHENRHENEGDHLEDIPPIFHFDSFWVQPIVRVWCVLKNRKCGLR